MKIFDSLIHPTLSGKYNKHGLSTSFTDIQASLPGTNIERLLAIGMPEEDYDHVQFYHECLKYPAFVPVAALTLNTPVSDELKMIKATGFKAVKIHPRSLAGKLTTENLQLALEEAARLDLRVLLCTYCFFDIRSKSNMSLENLLEVVSKTPRCLNLMLVHGGVFDLLQVLEISKYTENILVDLSFTMMKYTGSSLDLDIEYAMNFYDRKICIGSDFPDFSLKDFSERVCFLTKHLAVEKRENILYRNLATFMGMK